MKLRDTFDDNGRFEGDRLLHWRSIPADARIVSARATVRPVEALTESAFAESLSFNGVGEFGATKTKGTLDPTTTTSSWIEVDFHTRRTLARLAGDFSNARLQVDVGGGTYVEINRAGAFRTPSDSGNDAFFPINGQSVVLPALTVAKFKITNVTGSVREPAITTVSVISVPTNVSLRVGDLAPFFTHPGEMTLPEVTTDFAAVLQGALASAKVENGFYDLPLTIHSDSIARLQVELDVEFLLEQNPLPGGLPEVVLPFDFSTLAQSPAASLNVAVPPNTRVVPGQTTARVRGTFAESRVAFPARIGEVKPVAAVEVSATSPQTQFVATGTEITATAIDLLLESKTLSARLRLDIRADLDGKPGDTSLLATPIEFRVDQEAGKGARWISVQLASEFVFLSSQRYWLALQSLEGIAAWSVDIASAGAPNMESTRDGGLSWRDSLAMAGTQRDQTIPAAGPFAAFFRLRTQPKTFKVPIELQVGRDESEVRVKLDRFEPLGRVDFALDTELAQGINEYLDAASAACPETEHLYNGDFERWLRVGDDIKPQADIRTGAPIDALAFSPDGTLAYVLTSGFIKVIDVACNRLMAEKSIALTISPRAFVLSPDGTRAFVLERLPLPPSTAPQRLQIVDLSTGQVVGTPLDLQRDPNEREAIDLAITPDGTRLFVPLLLRITLNSNVIRVIDIAKLELQFLTGVPVTGVMEKKSVAAHDDQENSAKSVAVSPDGRLLYLVTDLDLNTEVRRVDTSSLTLIGPPIPVGNGANSIGISPDGSQAVVTNEADNSISIINTHQATSIKTVPVGAAPNDVAISSDGTKAYVLDGAGRTISVADLSRHTVVGDPIPIPPGADPTAVALALSPQGDQIYVANDEDVAANAFISPIQFGTRVPGEWQLTSGAVGPFCPGDPFHLVAILGSETMPTALSQVVPVIGSCTYEFSFWGLALEPAGNELPAMAEVLWFGKQCRPVGPNPDPIPIKVIEDAPVVAPPVPFGAPLFAPNAAGQAASLKFHRVRLTAPAGADQAEVRFSVSTRGVAAIDQISLMATLEAVANSDFQVRQNSQLSGWTISPAVAPGFALLDAVDGGIQLRNSSAVTVELVQLVEAKKEEPFTIDVQGKTLSGSSTQLNPELEIRWFKADGKPTGSPTIVGIVSGAFGSSTASGTAPADATQAEIHLRLPARTAVEVKNISLRFTKPVIVPVSFIAQSPGELIVSDVRIAFEDVEPKPPPISNLGLCPPTPPGREPGEGSHHCCFCTVCDSEQIVEEMGEVSTETGRPAMLARCMSCGTEFLRGSGVASTEAHPMSHDLGSPIVVSAAAMSVASAASHHHEARTLRLTDIHGIAGPRAKQLVDIGIDSVEKLAAATPETVAQIKFITLEMARNLVAQAKSLASPTT
jgi:YVTN family beta-propeller protein